MRIHGSFMRVFNPKGNVDRLFVKFNQTREYIYRGWLWRVWTALQQNDSLQSVLKPVCWFTCKLFYLYFIACQNPYEVYFRLGYCSKAGHLDLFTWTSYSWSNIEELALYFGHLNKVQILHSLCGYDLCLGPWTPWIGLGKEQKIPHWNLSLILVDGVKLLLIFLWSDLGPEFSA